MAAKVINVGLTATLDLATGNLYVFTKTAGGSEPANYTVSNANGDNQDAIALDITGSTATIVASQSANGAPNLSFTGLTGLPTNTVVFLVVGCVGNVNPGVPSGWTQVAQVTNSSPSSSLTVYSKPFSAGGSTGSVSVTLTGGTYANGWLVALKS